MKLQEMEKHIIWEKDVDSRTIEPGTLFEHFINDTSLLHVYESKIKY